MPNIKTHAIRIPQGSDLKKFIQNYVDGNNLQAAWIVTGVGSLTNYHIRFANRSSGTSGEGHFEIVSLAGTLSVDGMHIHISISDQTGTTLGGHLMDGCIIYTTAEIVIQSTENMKFKRTYDDGTGYKELEIITIL